MIVLTEYADTDDWIKSMIYFFHSYDDAYQELIKKVQSNTVLVEFLESKSINPFNWENSIEVKWDWYEELTINFDKSEGELLSFSFHDWSSEYYKYTLCEVAPDYYYNLHY